MNYSTIIRIAGVKKSNVRIYPTVTHNSFTLEVSREPVNTLKLIHSNGTIVFKKDLGGFTGNMPFVNLPTLAAGTYLVEISGNDKTERTKIIIQ